MEKGANFIATNKWPSGSPDLNPLDCSLWNYMEIMCARRHTNLTALKAITVKAMQKIPLKITRECIDNWSRRLCKYVGAKRGHFE